MRIPEILKSLNLTKFQKTKMFSTNFGGTGFGKLNLVHDIHFSILGELKLEVLVKILYANYSNLKV